MLNNQDLNQLSDRISQLLPPGLKAAKSDFDARLKTVLQQQLSQLEMVSREEFDLQAKVLQRTRSKLDALEQKLTELEKTIEK